MTFSARVLLISVLAAFVAACGSGAGGGDTTPGTPTDPGVPATFSLGPLSATATSLPAGGSTEISGTITDGSGNLFDGTATVNFSSACADNNEADLPGSITTTNGQFTITYTATGCVGNDTVSATTTIGDSASEVAISLNVQPRIFTLGSGSGAGFNEGVLNIGVASLSAGGTTSVTATIADGDGNLLQESATVTFTSDCVAAGLASIDSPVVTSIGTASTTYEAQGCAGTDTITATVTVDNRTSTATGSLEVQPAVVGSLQFLSAEPNAIGIRGFGLIETSRVTFRVLDTNGNRVANEEVNFALNTTVGGIEISDTSAISDDQGRVSVDVRSGTLATSVRVTATVAANPVISTQSDSLVVSTGIGDQDSMSLSASVLNPEAYIIDGTTSELTVRASDHFNNPVPDGTAIAFTTEGGQVQSQCLTIDGACSVTWTSSDPRPDNGRVTILASLVGEESFTDVNGNGVLDLGDTYVDMPEAFRDDNENGVFDDVQSLDFNSNNRYDGALQAQYTGFNGVLCCDTDAVAAAQPGDGCFGKTGVPVGTCSNLKNIHVRDQIVLVMAQSGLAIEPASLTLDGSGESVDSTTVSIYGVYPDGSFQPPALDTAITVTATNGTLESTGAFSIPNTNAPGPFTFTVRIKGDATPSSGSVRIEAVSPSGVLSTAFITVND